MEVFPMDVISTRACGIDVHQKQITVSTLIGAADTRPKRQVKTFETTTFALMACRQWLTEQDIEVVAMESTGQYWRPVWQILAPSGFRMILCNPRKIKGMPGRKTDRLDAEWIADLTRHGMISPSYVPKREIIELREATRARKATGHDATKYKNRIHNILQRSNIKLTSFVSDIFGGSGRKLLNLLINGEAFDLDVVAGCMHGRMKHKPEQILAAMNGTLSANDRRIINIEVAMLDSLEASLKDLDELIEEQLKPFWELYLRLQTIPGVSTRTAGIIIAEVGADTEAFEDAHRLASWVGLAPGNNESAGVSKSTGINHGNAYLKTAMVTAAMGAKAKKEGGLKDFFYRLTNRMGKMKALVALAHKMIRIVYVIITEGVTYQEYKKDQRALRTLVSKN
jgi:transposase